MEKIGLCCGPCGGKGSELATSEATGDGEKVGSQGEADVDLEDVGESQIKGDFYQAGTLCQRP